VSGGRPSNIPADDREPLEVLAEEFLERHRRGENPTTAEYCRAYPKLADKIPLVFPTLLAMEDLAGAGPDDTHSTPPADDRTVAETYASRTAAASMPAALGDHRMLREIGRGGMGVVYEAIEEPLGRHVALKVLSRPVGAEGFIERFRQEARAAARLHHTNIVPIFAVGEAGGIHYYTMQLIRGQTLAAVLDGLRRERRSENREKAEATTVESAAGASYATSVARIGLQIAEALSYAHAEGILHRDIKPANVLLDVRGTAWVTDFGLAKARDSDDLTESGDVVGTLRYMAPERFWGEGDARSDVYSLGATLYELIALVPPFEAKDRARLMRDVAAADVQPLKALNPRVPRDLETIILKAIARHPADRYATAAQLADDLRRFLAYEPISARRLYAWERVWRWRQRNPAAATLLLLVLALVVASAVGGVVSSLALRDERNFAFARLSDAKLEEGRVWRLSGVAGQRQRSLAALGEAIAGNPVTEVRSEVISALALTDLDVVSEEATPGESVVYDARLERFAMRGSSDSIDVYDEARRGAPVARLSGGAPFSQYHCRFSPSGKYLGVRHHEATPVLAIWDIDRASVLWKSPAPVDDVALDFSPDENFVASCERVGGVVLRRLADGEVVRRMEAGVACRKLEFDRSGRRLAGMQDGSASQVILVFDVETGMPIARLHHPERAAHVAWDPEGKALAVACFDFNVYVWSTSSWERLHVLRGHQGEVFRVAFDPRGDVLASAGWDEHTRLWDARSGEFLVVAQGRFTSFSSDGLRLGFVLGESRRGVWSVERSKEFRSLSVPFSNLRAKEPKDLRFSDNGRWLAATAGARGVRLWSIDALERPYRPRRARRAGRRVPPGRLVAHDHRLGEPRALADPRGSFHGAHHRRTSRGNGNRGEPLRPGRRGKAARHHPRRHDPRARSRGPGENADRSGPRKRAPPGPEPRRALGRHCDVARRRRHRLERRRWRPHGPLPCSQREHRFQPGRPAPGRGDRRRSHPLHGRYVDAVPALAAGQSREQPIHRLLLGAREHLCGGAFSRGRAALGHSILAGGGAPRVASRRGCRVDGRRSAGWLSGHGVSFEPLSEALGPVGAALEPRAAGAQLGERSAIACAGRVAEPRFRHEHSRGAGLRRKAGPGQTPRARRVLHADA
jgi:WD40 repeat protein